MQRGRNGERAAVRFLKKAGYRILEKNWQAGHYELDIVAEQAGSKQQCIVFVEVRGRCIENLQSGYNTVNRQKKRALFHAIHVFLKKHPHVHHYRLDIISIDWDINGKILSLQHYENVSMR